MSELLVLAATVLVSLIITELVFDLGEVFYKRIDDIRYPYNIGWIYEPSWTDGEFREAEKWFKEKGFDPVVYSKCSKTLTFEGSNQLFKDNKNHYYLKKSVLGRGWV